MPTKNKIFPFGKRAKKTKKLAFTEYHEKFLLRLVKNIFFLSLLKQKKVRTCVRTVRTLRKYAEYARAYACVLTRYFPVEPKPFSLAE